MPGLVGWFCCFSFLTADCLVPGSWPLHARPVLEKVRCVSSFVVVVFHYLTAPCKDCSLEHMASSFAWWWQFWSNYIHIMQPKIIMCCQRRGACAGEFLLCALFCTVHRHCSLVLPQAVLQILIHMWEHAHWYHIAEVVFAIIRVIGAVFLKACWVRSQSCRRFRLLRVWFLFGNHPPGSVQKHICKQNPNHTTHVTHVLFCPKSAEVVQSFNTLGILL